MAPGLDRHVRGGPAGAVELVDPGDDTVVAVEAVRRTREGSAELRRIRPLDVFTNRDGKIARGREFSIREQALEAAGLSE